MQISLPAFLLMDIKSNCIVVTARKRKRFCTASDGTKTFAWFIWSSFLLIYVDCTHSLDSSNDDFLLLTLLLSGSERMSFLVNRWWSTIHQHVQMGLTCSYLWLPFKVSFWPCINPLCSITTFLLHYSSSKISCISVIDSIFSSCGLT